MDPQQQASFARNMQQHFLDTASMKSLGRVMIKNQVSGAAKVRADRNTMWYAAAQVAVRLQSEVDSLVEEDKKSEMLYAGVTGLGDELHRWLGGSVEPGPSLALAMKVWIAANMTTPSYLNGRTPAHAASELGEFVTERLTRRVMEASRRQPE